MPKFQISTFIVFVTLVTSNTTLTMIPSGIINAATDDAQAIDDVANLHQSHSD